MPSNPSTDWRWLERTATLKVENKIRIRQFLKRSSALWKDKCPNFILAPKTFGVQL